MSSGKKNEESGYGLHLIGEKWSEMTLNNRVIVETYPLSNGVVGGLISAVKSFLYLMGEKN